MNIYCFSTLSFAKLQFKSVINKAFHKHGVASFTDAWIETWPIVLPVCCILSRIFYRCVDWNIFICLGCARLLVASFTDAWIETGLIRITGCKHLVASFTDAWIETIQLLFCDICDGRIFYRCVDWNHFCILFISYCFKSHLLQMRGLKQK